MMPTSIPEVRSIIDVPGPIRVARRQQCLVVETNDFRDVELPVLEILRTEAVRPSNTDGGFRLRRCSESLLLPDPPRPNAGLEWIVRYVLSQAEIEQTPPRSVVGSTSACGNILGELPRDEHLLRFVQNHNHGLIRCSPGVDNASLIAQITKAWPTAKIAIVSGTRRPLRPLAKKLRQLGIRTSVLSCRHCPENPARVVLGTFIDMAHTPVGFAQRYIVILLHAPDVLLHDAQFSLTAAISRFRLFGLLPDDCQLSPYERDWLTAAFSLDEIVIPRHGYRKVEPQVAWMPNTTLGCGDVKEDWEAKERLIQHSHIRNRRIARIAKALVAADCPTITTECPQAADCLREESPNHVVVLVEGVDHALALAERLPRWPIVTGPDVNEFGLLEKQCRLLADRRKGWTNSPGIIATGQGAETLNNIGNGVLVVVWAGAGAHVPSISSSWLVCPADSDRQLLIVDVYDRGHRLLERWSRRRHRSYRKAGWFAPGQKPDVERIKMFLASRTRRRSQ